MKQALLNPFEKISETKLVIFGIIATLLGSYLGYLFNGRYDGVIDLHFTDSVSLLQPFIDNLINIASLFLLLFLAGKFINKKTRIIDILNPILIARIPFYFLTFSNFRNYISDITKSLLAMVDLKNKTTNLNLETSHILFLGFFTIVTIAFLVWFVILLYNGFKVATNCKTVPHKIYFGLSILAAEIVSGIAISLLNY